MTTDYSYNETLALARIELEEQMVGASNPGNTVVLSIPLILGPVGAGKTSIAYDLAKEFDLEVVEINCGENSDPVDVGGMPCPTIINGKGEEIYMPFVVTEAIHRACQEPVMLFFDDVDKMPAMVEGALIGIFGKRQVKLRKLHPRTLIITAGNCVGDDILARTLSESLRTRATAIKMTPSVQEFCEFGLRTGRLHEVFAGFLSYKPEYLHQKREDVLRFPTPRCWEEASARCREYPDATNITGSKKKQRRGAWEIFVSLKCGDHIGSDFGAWYNVVRKVNVKKILTEGDVEHNFTDQERASQYMVEYAAIFAVSQELNHNGVKPAYKGLEKWVTNLASEMRVAFVTQLTPKSRQQIAELHDRAADMLLKDLIPSGAQTP